MDELTFDEFAAFIRQYWHVSHRKRVLPETQFERDLGLTGDDGDDLLKATEKRFGVTLGSEETGVRETFNLGPNEYLFHSEGWNPSPFRFTSLFDSVEPTIREFTVGELFEAVRKARGIASSTPRRMCE
jgi:hypothetical protein